MNRKYIFATVCTLILAFTFSMARAAEKSDNDTPAFFAVASVDKTEADVNDQLLYTIKFYMDPNAQLEAVGNLHFKFNGFNAEEVDPFFFQNYRAEKYNGKTYRTLTWKQFVLTPQKKGTFVLPSYKATASLIVYLNDNEDDMDPFSFFFRRRRGQRKAVKFTTKAIKIKISGSKKKAQPKQQPEDSDDDNTIEFKKI